MKIEVLFPEICNLYGDLMNPEFLSRSSSEFELVNTSLKSEPLFATEKPALIYMGTMTERSQELALTALMPHRERIIALIDEGVPFLITGNAMELFGEYILLEDGRKIDCLGIFPIYAKRQMMNRYNSLYIGKFGDMDIVGFKSQFSHSYGDNSSFALFETTRGAGLNTEVMAEGVRKNNFFGTYLIGPLLVLNPPFAKYLMELIGIPEPSLEFERECYDVYEHRIKEFSEPNRGFIY